MLCIHSSCTDPYFNLAAEEYLLKHFKEDIFILWQNEPSVIIGKHQNVWIEINEEIIQREKIKVARRFSGGGAVYHDRGNVNITFIETTRNANFDRFPNEMKSMLSFTGLNIKADNRRGLYLDGYKISGSAQSVYKDRILYHATLLFSSDLERLHDTLEVMPSLSNQPVSRKVTVPSVKSPVANLADHLSGQWTLERFKEYIFDYFYRVDPSNCLYSYSENDKYGINQLKKTKYATPAWIYEGRLV